MSRATLASRILAFVSESPGANSNAVAVGVACRRQDVEEIVTHQLAASLYANHIQLLTVFARYRQAPESSWVRRLTPRGGGFSWAKGRLSRESPIYW